MNFVLIALVLPLSLSIKPLAEYLQGGDIAAGAQIAISILSVAIFLIWQKVMQ